MLDVGYAVRIGGVLEVGEEWRELERQVLLVVELMLLLLVELGRSWCMQVRVVLRERVVLQEYGAGACKEGHVLRERVVLQVYGAGACKEGHVLRERVVLQEYGAGREGRSLGWKRGLFSGLEERVVLWVGRIE